MRTDGMYFRIVEALALAVALGLLTVGTVAAAPFFSEGIEVLEIALCGEDPECEADCEEGCQEAFGSCFVKPGTEGGPDLHCHYNSCEYKTYSPRVANCTYHCYRSNPCPPE